jgi:outer membrane protein assembly factor BamB
LTNGDFFFINYFINELKKRRWEMKFILIKILIFMTITSFGLIGSDWPQYLGPNRNAVSSEKGLLRSWPEKGPQVLWSFPLGEGFGGPVVRGSKVYILDRVDNRWNVLRCINITDGKEEWTFSHEAPGETGHNGSRSVPLVDGNYIYICCPWGYVHCINLKTHKAVWRKNIWTDFGGTELPRWALAQNPLVYKDLLILASQTEKAGVVAYDKLTGSIRWKSPKLPGRTGYASPKVITISNHEHLVMISANGAVMGMDLTNGKTLWSYSDWQCRIPVPNVTEIGDGRLFITGGYLAGSAMIKLSKEGNEFKVKELFRIKEFSTHVHPPVLYKEHLYGHCSTNEIKDGMVCMDLTGNVKWKTKRSPLFDKGGFMLVDGMLLSVDGTKGFLYLIDPNPTAFKVISKAKLLDTSKCWAPLALSNGKLLIRDQKQMKCVNLR